ncbi:hypothetical protein BDV3_004529 [Batrachochytrium dendrobatidis]
MLYESLCRIASKASYHAKSILLDILSSKKLTVCIGICIGTIHLALLSGIIALLISWQNIQMGQCEYSNPATCECATQASLPGILLMSFTIGWMLWPLYVIISNIQVLIYPGLDIAQNPPAYFTNILQCQYELIDWIFTRAHLPYRMEVVRALTQIRYTPVNTTPYDTIESSKAIPYEIQHMILRIVNADLEVRKNKYTSRLLLPTIPTPTKKLHDSIQIWLQPLAMVMGFNENPFGINPYYTIMGGKQDVWIAMFSRDLALLSFSIIMRASCIMVLYRCIRPCIAVSQNAIVDGVNIEF